MFASAREKTLYEGASERGSEGASVQKVSPIWRARGREGRSEEAPQFAPQPTATLPLPTIGPTDRPRDSGGDAESIFSSRSDDGD